ncbi:MAG: hypothetical protein V1921_06830 [Candidatus Altiarchaeota archaeon]
MIFLALLSLADATELLYDDGSANGGWLLNLEGEWFGVWFNTTENYLETIRFYITNTDSDSFTYYVFNGTQNNYSGQVAWWSYTATTTGWHNITINNYVTDDFWVLYRPNGVGGYPAIGYDRTAPIDNHSRYSADNGDTWYLWTSDDIMIRAVVSSGPTTTTTSTSTSTTSTSTSSTSTTTIATYLTVNLVSPNASANITNGTSMNFTATVTCVGGSCGNITATLDPVETAFASPAEQFKNTYGSNWDIEADENRIRVLGYGLSPEGISTATTSAQLDSVTRNLLRQNSQVFGLDEADLKTFRIDADVLKDKIAYYLYYNQNYNGIPVEDSYVMVAYKNNKIVEIKSKFFGGIKLDTRPEITLEEASDISRQMMGIHSGVGPAESELVIFPVNVDKSTVYVLSWKIGFPMVPETNGSWTLIVDARNGNIVRYWDSNRYQVSGTVTGKIYPEKLSDGQITKNFSNEYVYVQQGASTLGNSTTNNSGAYSVAEGSDSVNVYSQLKGPWAWVLNEDAAEAVHNQSITAGTTHNWDWDAEDTSDRNEESNMFYHINLIHDFYTSGAPFNITSMSYRMNATVEHQTGYCNAYYTGNSESMLFGAGNLSASCENLALFSDVIYHEYTHGVVDHIYPVNFPYIDETGAMNEGWADYFACTINNNSPQAEEALPSSSIRDLNNTDKFLDDWINEVHVDSTQISGARWDVRGALGKETADALIMGAIKLLPFSFSEELDDMLISDDDNANLADGTPNINAICSAYYDNHDISSGYCANHTQTALFNVTLLKYFDSPVATYTNLGTYATKFTPPSYPANLTKFMGVFLLQYGNRLNYTVHVYADNSGEPGAELMTPINGTVSFYAYPGTITYVSVVNLSVQIDSGSFWLGVELFDSLGPILIYSNTSTSTSKYSSGAAWQVTNPVKDPFIKAGVRAYLSPPMPPTTTSTTTTILPGETTTTSTSTSTSTTTTISSDKGVVPMNSGSPFYTTSDNPRYPNNLSCLQNMAGGSSCNVTWLIFASGSYQAYTFYAIANASTLQNESSRINLTILEPAQIRFNEFLPNPSSGLEWIELYSLGSSDVSLVGWTLNNSAGSYNITSSAITGGGFTLFYGNVTSLTLNDSYGMLYLLYPNNSISDNVTYNCTALNASWSAIPAGVSIGRETDGNGSFIAFSSPTPGSGNTVYSQIALLTGWNLISLPLLIT